MNNTQGWQHAYIFLNNTVEDDSLINTLKMDWTRTIRGCFRLFFYKVVAFFLSSFNNSTYSFILLNFHSITRTFELATTAHGTADLRWRLLCEITQLWDNHTSLFRRFSFSPSLLIVCHESRHIPLFSCCCCLRSNCLLVMDCCCCWPRLTVEAVVVERFGQEWHHFGISWRYHLGRHFGL